MIDDEFCRPSPWYARAALRARSAPEVGSEGRLLAVVWSDRSRRSRRYPDHREPSVPRSAPGV